MPDVPLSIEPTLTPNPRSTKYVLNRSLVEGPGFDFPEAQGVRFQSGLAGDLFSIPGVAGVYIGPNFVTVTATESPAIGFEDLVLETIEEFVLSGKPPVNVAAVEDLRQRQSEPLGDIEARVVRILETEIQPAVAMDGGFIEFHSYEDGVVRLALRGACHGCPSSIYTLKAGIEARLQREIPEIVAVEAI
jgi:Fe-S cluster biogenesis protein NfuA